MKRKLVKGEKLYMRHRSSPNGTTVEVISVGRKYFLVRREHSDQVFKFTVDTWEHCNGYGGTLYESADDYANQIIDSAVRSDFFATIGRLRNTNAEPTIEQMTAILAILEGFGI